MNNYTEEVTVILISYKSKNKIIKFIENISIKVKIIIIENSKDNSIKVEKFNNNVELIIVKNKGYGSSINYARTFVKTKYFFIFNPDVENVDDDVIKKFHSYAKKLNNNFACLGPRYINISTKTLIQSREDREIDILPSISGAAMFFDKCNFDLVEGFDENFFLYFEETDYCYRAKQKGLFSYQINSIKLNHNVGTSIEYENDLEMKKIKELQIWHFIWSKIYFYKKKYGSILCYIYFTQLYLRTKFKLIIFRIQKDENKTNKYKTRLEGMITSIKGLKSNKRID